MRKVVLGKQVDEQGGQDTIRRAGPIHMCRLSRHAPTPELPWDKLVREPLLGVGQVPVEQPPGALVQRFAKAGVTCYPTFE